MLELCRARIPNGEVRPRNATSRCCDGRHGQQLTAARYKRTLR